MGDGQSPDRDRTILSQPFAEKCYRRIFWRIMPLLFLGYFIAYLDRANVAFARLQMQDALGFSDAVFGAGAGIMFLGYFLFEMPSNMLLARTGARLNIARILILWGIAASATMFVRTPAQFYVVRFLLGVFEAGFFPGVVLYLTYWFPADRRGRLIGLFFSATVFAGIVAGPLSGATMKFLDGHLGLGGWQWLYLTQGLPAVVLGIVTLLVLRDRPADAAWLSETEKAAVAAAVGGDAAPPAVSFAHQIRELLHDRHIYLLLAIDFLVLGGTYTLVFWTPGLIKGWGVSDVFQIGLLSAIPNAIGVIGMIAITRSSDIRQERRLHFLGSIALAVVGLVLTTGAAQQLPLSLLGLCIASFGIAGATPLVVTMASDYIAPRIAPAGIALVTSGGILGAAAGPTMAGIINARTGSGAHAIHGVMLLFLIAAGLMMLMPARRRISRRDDVADGNPASQAEEEKLA